MEFMTGVFSKRKDLEKQSHPLIASCVLATALCLTMSPSHAWYEDYHSCVNAVQSNCQYTDFYMNFDFGPYPDYDQCVAMGIQIEGCESFRTNPSDDDSAQVIEEVVVIGAIDPVVTSPINNSPIANPANISVPIGEPAFTPGGSDEGQSAGEREDCLDDATLEKDSCEVSVKENHLAQYGACEAVSWLGWVLNGVSLGVLGSVPNTCGQKLDLKRDLELAKCVQHYEVNKYLCKLI